MIDFDKNKGSAPCTIAKAYLQNIFSANWNLIYWKITTVKKMPKFPQRLRNGQMKAVSTSIKLLIISISY